MKESSKNNALKKSIGENAQKYHWPDPNYPLWGNMDQLDETGGVIRINPAEIAIPIFPHLLAHLYQRWSNKTIYHSIAQRVLYGTWEYLGERLNRFYIICITRAPLSATLKLVWGNSDQLSNFTWGNSDHSSYFSWTPLTKPLTL